MFVSPEMDDTLKRIQACLLFELLEVCFNILTKIYPKDSSEEPQMRVQLVQKANNSARVDGLTESCLANFA